MKRKIVVVTCYKKPDYIRGVVLRSALSRLPDMDVLIIKNKTTGIFRYTEVIIKLVKLRVIQNPDVYIITFRGYEILPIVRLICMGKRIIYDEFISPIEWIAYEHKKVKIEGLPHKILTWFYSKFAGGVDVIFADTDSHARFSAQLLGLSIKKYVVVPVGTDEKVFKRIQHIKGNPRAKKFKVFYYGSMLPLHGLEYVCEAAVELAKHDKNIEFHLIGGGKEADDLIQQAVGAGASIVHEQWVDFKELPKYVEKSDVCLGGPFGATVQSQMVITGKTYQFLASGKATIIGRITQKTHFVDKENCLLVEQGSPEGLIESLRWAKQHRNELRVIGNNGRKLFDKQFSVERISTLLSEVLQ
ncbi:hypothetical protein BH23PAT1_BH23PAT1_1220 [soil metagenome]